MNFNEFTQCIKSAVTAKCDSSMKIEIRQVLKNNSLNLTGIVMCGENENAAPAIYLENCYDDYMKGRSIDEIADDIIYMYDHYKGKCPVDIESFLLYDNIKDRILYKVINKSRNMLLLENIPHRDILDLSIVFYCCIGEFDDGNIATALIYNEHMSMWEVDEEELYSVASQNMRIRQPYKIINFGDLIKELSGEKITEEADMYVVTSSNKLYGACWAFDDEVITRLYEQFGDFYILPSSIHEVIIVPEKDTVEGKYLVEMVESVNETQLSAEEILSDSVYLYRGINNEFLILNNINEGCTNA